eukprot:UN21510
MGGVCVTDSSADADQVKYYDMPVEEEKRTVEKSASGKRTPRSSRIRNRTRKGRLTEIRFPRKRFPTYTNKGHRKNRTSYSHIMNWGFDNDSKFKGDPTSPRHDDIDSIDLDGDSGTSYGNGSIPKRNL